MAKEKKLLLAFNRGVISKIGLSRIDIERMGMSAEQQANFVPRVLGSMMLRPGTEFLGFMPGDLKLARQLPFIFGSDDTALIELSSDGVTMRVRIDDVLLTRPTVGTTIVNPSFTTGFGIGDWVDVSIGTSTVVQFGGNFARFNSSGSEFAVLQQSVAVAVPDQGVEHALRFTVPDHGELQVRIGSAAGLDDYLQQTVVGSGTHDIEFTPLATPMFVEILSDREYNFDLGAMDLAASGIVSFIMPWDEFALPNLRWAQSGDVIYLAADRDNGVAQGRGVNPVKIERRGTGRSWSIVDYKPDDGPFRVQNTGPITLTPSAIDGAITVTASEPLFRGQHVSFGPGALFQIRSIGQVVTDSVGSATITFTDPIRVTGKDDARVFTIIIEGTFVATITLQFAFDPAGPWTDVSTFTAPTSETYDDLQEDAVLYYRIGLKAGADWTSGTATFTLVYASGSITGVVRLTNIVSNVVADAVVLKNLGSLDATPDWSEGEWSRYRGYPTSVEIHEGRLWWAGLTKIWGSISDTYESFDEDFEGDAGPISRIIGQGPINTINWMVGLNRLLVGTAEISAQVDAGRINGNSPLAAMSSSFDEPLTPSNFNIRPVQSKALYVDRTEQRLYELAWSGGAVQDFEAQDLSIFTPDFNEAGITQIAVQHKPDVRIHCVRSDGTVGMLVYDRAENVIAWVDVDVNPNGALNGSGAGFQHCVEDVAILPGTVEDQVYYTVKRSNGAVSGSNQGEERHLEKWALESEAVGGTVNKMADNFTHYSGAPISTLTGLNHLAGLSCTVWADGADKGAVTVGTTGTFDADLSGLDGAPFSEIVIGFEYRGRFKSTKLASVTGNVNLQSAGIGLHDRKKVNRIGLVLRNSHYQALQYGPTFDLLRDMPAVENGVATGADTIWTDYDEDNFAFGGDWDTDSRVCLEAVAPRPCTVLSAVINMESVEPDLGI